MPRKVTKAPKVPAEGASMTHHKVKYRKGQIVSIPFGPNDSGDLAYVQVINEHKAKVLTQSSQGYPIPDADGMCGLFYYHMLAHKLTPRLRAKLFAARLGAKV